MQYPSQTYTSSLGEIELFAPQVWSFLELEIWKRCILTFDLARYRNLQMLAWIMRPRVSTKDFERLFARLAVFEIIWGLGTLFAFPGHWGSAETPVKTRLIQHN